MEIYAIKSIKDLFALVLPFIISSIRELNSSEYSSNLCANLVSPYVLYPLCNLYNIERAEIDDICGTHCKIKKQTLSIIMVDSFTATLSIIFHTPLKEYPLPILTSSGYFIILLNK